MATISTCYSWATLCRRMCLYMCVCMCVTRFAYTTVNNVMYTSVRQLSHMPVAIASLLHMQTMCDDREPVVCLCKWFSGRNSFLFLLPLFLVLVHLSNEYTAEQRNTCSYMPCIMCTVALTDTIGS